MSPVSMSKRPCMSFLTPESLQVGLERIGLLFQGKEPLLHLVKLQGDFCFLFLAGF